MTTPIENRDLTKQAPHSPHARFGGFAIIGRTVDKCRASIAGKVGEYHYDCPLDNQLFDFKGINGAQFKTAVTSSKSYEDVAKWLESNGVKKSPEEIKAWSDKAEAFKLKEVIAKKSPEDRKAIEDSCRKLGLDTNQATLFEWLEADDRAAFHDEHAELASK